MPGISKDTLAAWHNLPDNSEATFESLTDEGMVVLFHLAAPAGVDVVKYNKQTIALLREDKTSFDQNYEMFMNVDIEANGLDI